MAAGASVEMSDVTVHFEFGENSKPETERIFEKAKEAILEAVPHATITFVKKSDYGKETFSMERFASESFPGSTDWYL